MNIVDLLERARANLDVSSDRALCRGLGITWSSFALYTSGRGYPNDETMLRICAVANVPEREGLLLLNLWRATGRAATIYRQIWQELCPDKPKTHQAKRQ